MALRAPSKYEQIIPIVKDRPTTLYIYPADTAGLSVSALRPRIDVGRIVATLRWSIREQAKKMAEWRDVARRTFVAVAVFLILGLSFPPPLWSP
jgi:hypothetical protein